MSLFFVASVDVVVGLFVGVGVGFVGDGIAVVCLGVWRLGHHGVPGLVLAHGGGYLVCLPLRRAPGYVCVHVVVAHKVSKWRSPV